LDDDNVSLICNEEGKLDGLPLNRDIGYDIIAGPFIIAGDDFENGDFISLTEAQIEKYKKRFGKESITETEKKVVDLLFKRNNKKDKEIEY